MKDARQNEGDHCKGGPATKPANKNAHLLKRLPHPDFSPAAGARPLVNLDELCSRKAHLAKRKDCASAHRVRAPADKGLRLFGK